MLILDEVQHCWPESGEIADHAWLLSWLLKLLKAQAVYVPWIVIMSGSNLDKWEAQLGDRLGYDVRLPSRPIQTVVQGMAIVPNRPHERQSPVSGTSVRALSDGGAIVASRTVNDTLDASDISTKSMAFA